MMPWWGIGIRALNHVTVMIGNGKVRLWILRAGPMPLAPHMPVVDQIAAQPAPVPPVLSPPSKEAWLTPRGQWWRRWNIGMVILWVLRAVPMCEAPQMIVVHEFVAHPAAPPLALTIPLEDLWTAPCERIPAARPRHALNKTCSWMPKNA